MILTPMRRYGAMILMLLTIAFSGDGAGKDARNTNESKVPHN